MRVFYLLVIAGLIYYIGDQYRAFEEHYGYLENMCTKGLTFKHNGVISGGREINDYTNATGPAGLKGSPSR